MKMIFLATFICSLFLPLSLALGAPQPPPRPSPAPPPCPPGVCDIDPPTPAHRLSKIDVSIGFGARSFYEIPNYSYLTDSVSLVFSMADGGIFQFDHLLHGMNPAKYITLILRGRDRLRAQSMSVTIPDGRYYTTSCYSQPADACYLPLESSWVTAPVSGPYDIRHVTRSGRYLVKVYYEGSTPTKTLSFRTP